jgi:hypothetical protein
MDDPLAKLLLISGVCGVGGAILGFLHSVLSKSEQRARVEIATGIGFLVGASLGALFGIFATMAGRV